MLLVFVMEATHFYGGWVVAGFRKRAALLVSSEHTLKKIFFF